MNALIKEPKKPATLKTLSDDQAVRLREMQTIVGGYIELVRLSPKLAAIVNENGRMLGLPKNAFGLVGTIVFCGIGEDEFTDVPEDDLLLEVI